MQAVILAAGMGKRLKQLTRNNTKCMVKVNGETLLARALNILGKKYLSRIVIVIGYEGNKVIDFVNELSIGTPVCFVWNRQYETTNNIYSLALAKEYLQQEDTLLLESDIIFEEGIIDLLLDDDRPSLALVDKFESWMDGSCMVIDENDCITNFVPSKYFDFGEKEKYYKTVNIYKLSTKFLNNTYLPFLEAYEKAMGDNEYYESVIKLIVMLDTNEIRAKRLNGQRWYEIDDIQDLDIAELLFEENSEKRYHRLMKRYGGFWRFPHLIDFCYLVNPYCPNKRMLDEMLSNYRTLLSEYSSGREADSIIASNVFDVGQDHIVLGNGAAELIKVFMERQKGKMGIVCPTFNEYKNRYQNDVEIYYPDNEQMRYDEKDIINYFDTCEINSLVLINPDNPSGNYIPFQGLVKILEWSKKNNIKVLVDESFVDFVDLSEKDDIENISLIHEEILDKFPGLYVIKSISKSYGVPGLRIGILASADWEMIDYIKETLPIWNINSMAENFMQIFNKYKNEYRNAMKHFRAVRCDFIRKLSEIEYLKVLPTQANYVMCELTKGSSKDLCIYLFERGILIKDLSDKVINQKNYVRMAIRNERDNDILIGALNSYKA